jgi:hypothetical protein
MCFEPQPIAKTALVSLIGINDSRVGYWYKNLGYFLVSLVLYMLLSMLVCRGYRYVSQTPPKMTAHNPLARATWQAFSEKQQTGKHNEPKDHDERESDDCYR